MCREHIAIYANAGHSPPDDVEPSAPHPQQLSPPCRERHDTSRPSPRHAYCLPIVRHVCLSRPHVADVHSRRIALSSMRLCRMTALQP